MIRVLGLVSFRIFPTLMGGQKGVALFYRYLKQHVEVVLALSNNNEPTNEVEAHPLLYPNRAIYRNLGCIGRLRKLAETRKVDLVIAEHSYSGWIAWMLRRPFVLHSHNIESQRFRQMHQWWWRLYHRYEGWIHRRAEHNFFISQEDLDYARSEFGLEARKCSVITYGVEPRSIHPDRAALKEQLGLPGDRPVLLFNGTLDYTPNYEAVIAIIERLAPMLDRLLPRYLVVVTGNRAPEKLTGRMRQCRQVHYAGYVPDVDQYYQAADLFINPVSNDTGVKTKLIEALANGCTAVSIRSGASGIPAECCGEKLLRVQDGDWEGFALTCVQALDRPEAGLPPAFYDYYLWPNIAARAAQTLHTLVRS